MVSVRISSLTALVVLGFAASLIARAEQASVRPPLQEQVQTPVFTSRIDLTRLDIRVVDQRGRPVTDLTERDFTIFENGVRQEIRAFARQTFDVNADNADVPASGALTPHQRRVFLFVFGVALEEPVKPHDGAARFIRERLVPGDLVAVMAFNRVTDFTTDHEMAARVVEQLKGSALDVRHALLLSSQSGASARVERDRSRPSVGIQALIDGYFQPLRIRSATSLLLGTSVFRENDEIYSRPSRQPPWDYWLLQMNMLRVQAGVEYLRTSAPEGDKHLVALVTSLGQPPPGFLRGSPAGTWGLRDERDDLRLATRAADAQIALSIIHTAGVNRGDSFLIMASQNVARLTGGQYTSLSVADQALGRLDDATRAGYILGYTPSHSVMDGRYRNVEVRVNWRDLEVQYRHGYTARPDTPPLELREMATSVRLSEAAATDYLPNDIQVKAEAVVKPGTGNQQQVHVSVTIDASRLTLVDRAGQHEGSIDLWILCGDAKQQVVGVLKQQMTLSMDAAHYARAMAGGIPYTTTIPVTGRPAQVKVLVYDYEADMLGSVMVQPQR